MFRNIQILNSRCDKDMYFHTYFLTHLHKILVKENHANVCITCVRKSGQLLEEKSAEILKLLPNRDTIFLIYYFFFRLSTVPERLLFALIATEIVLSALTAELSGTVTLIFQFRSVPRKYIHFPPLSKFRASSDFHGQYFASERGCSPRSHVCFQGALPHTCAIKLC